MNRLIGIVGHLFLMLFGYCAAALAVSAFLHVLLYANAGIDPAHATGADAGALIFSIPFIALFVANFAFLPSLAALAICEWLSRRDWLSYAIAGAAIGIVGSAMLWQVARPQTEARPPDLAPVSDTLFGQPGFYAAMVAGGIIGGLVYWLIAGRRAGMWKRVRITSSAP